MARTADGNLSPDPEAYFLRNFHFNNEIYRDAEIGMSLTGYQLEIFDR